MARSGSNHESRMFALVLLCGLPAVALTLGLLWLPIFNPPGAETATGPNGSVSPAALPTAASAQEPRRLPWTLTVVILGCWLGGAALVRQKVRFPLQTIANILSALREGDYSIRARGAGAPDALGEVFAELNSLGEHLHAERLSALEATALLGKVVAEIDVALFTFDHESKLRLVNPAGARLLSEPEERLLGRTATELGLDACLEDEPARTFQAGFAGGKGRFGMRRSSFREGGLPHQLLVLSDLSRALREEERQAWQRLLRVLGHELNNSLAPIQSIAQTLRSTLARERRPADWEEDLASGLGVIAGRAEALNRFLEAYSRIARLPPPNLRPIALQPCLERVLSLETRMKVHLLPGPAATVLADPDQLDQLLINLVRNAIDAALETAGNVTVAWRLVAEVVELSIEDNGPGLANTANVFVPFFTTKPGGSGIGLVLCRQIAEAHGGSLTLENRPDASGCVARLQVPLAK